MRIKHQIAIIVLASKGTELHHTIPLMSDVLLILPQLTPGQVVRISS